LAKICEILVEKMGDSCEIIKKFMDLFVILKKMMLLQGNFLSNIWAILEQD
jgi:hypothetical protein